MTFYEFNILLEAFQLQQVDRDRDMHWQAFLNFQVTGTKKKGCPVYQTFKKFYDYEKELKKIQGGEDTSRIDDIGKILYGGGD